MGLGIIQGTIMTRGFRYNIGYYHDMDLRIIQGTIMTYGFRYNLGYCHDIWVQVSCRVYHDIRVYVPRKPRKHQDGGCRGRNSKQTPSAYISEATAHIGFVVNKVALGQVFSPNTSVLSPQCYSSNASYYLSCICHWRYTIIATDVAFHHNTTLSLWNKRLISKAILHAHVTCIVQRVRT